MDATDPVTWVEAVDGISAIGGMIVAFAMFFAFQYFQLKITSKSASEDRGSREKIAEADRAAQLAIAKECRDAHSAATLRVTEVTDASTKTQGEISAYLANAATTNQRLLAFLDRPAAS